MKSIVRGACVLAAAGVLVTVLSRYGVMGSGGGSGTVLSSYGYWTTDEGLETMLLINNPKSTDLDLTLSIHDRRGRNLVDHHFTLGGSESSNLALSTIVGKGRFGYMQITFPADACILPAQALISNGTDGISLDMHDERDLNGAVPKAHGLIPSIAARSSSIRLILT